MHHDCNKMSFNMNKLPIVMEKVLLWWKLRCKFIIVQKNTKQHTDAKSYQRLKSFPSFTKSENVMCKVMSKFEDFLRSQNHYDFQDISNVVSLFCSMMIIVLTNFLSSLFTLIETVLMTFLKLVHPINLLIVVLLLAGPSLELCFL